MDWAPSTVIVAVTCAALTLPTCWPDSSSSVAGPRAGMLGAPRVANISAAAPASSPAMAKRSRTAPCGLGRNRLGQ